MYVSILIQDRTATPLEVTLCEGESQDSLLRRFQRTVEMSGILRKARAHRYFISKKDTLRIKAKNNAKQRQRQR